MGELAALSASAMWAIASVLFAKLGKEETSPLALNFLKCTLALVMLWLTMLALGYQAWPMALTTTELAALAVSGLIGLTIGDTAYFSALIRLGPRRALLFTTLAPPSTALLAWPVLGEPITATMALGMALTLGGIGWVISERTDTPDPDAQVTLEDDTEEVLLGLSRQELIGVAFALVGVFCQAGGNVLTKLGGQNISSLETSVVRLTFGVIGLGVMVGALGQLPKVVQPLKKVRSAATLFVATLLGTYLGIWLLVTGFLYAKVGIAATLSSTSPIFILPIAALFLGEKLSGRAIFGALIAVAGVALLCITG